MTEPWNAAEVGVIRLPSGRLVRGRGLRRCGSPDLPATFSVFLLRTRPADLPWESRWLQWRDFWLPSDTLQARTVLTEAWTRSLNDRVEIVCGSGRGRTGTALACLAIIDGIPADCAVAYVREHYDKRAIETQWQRRYVEHFKGP